MKRFFHCFRYLRHALIPVALLVLLSLGISLGIAMFPGLWKMLYDKLFITLDPVLLAKFTGIELYCIVYLAVFEICFSLTRTLLTARISAMIRLDCQHRLHRATLSFINTTDSGFLMKRIVEDSEEIAEGIARLLTIGANLLIIAAIIVLLHFIAPWLVGLYTALIAGAILWMLLFSRPIQRQNRRIGDSYSGLYSLLYELFGGIMTVKLENRYRTAADKLDAGNTALRQSLLGNALANCFMWQYGGFFNTVAYGFILVAGLQRIEEGNLSVGLMLGLLMLVSWFQDPVQKLYGSVASLQAGIAAARRIEALLHAPQEPSGTVHLDRIRAGVEFGSVTFSYDEGTTVLSDVTLAVPCGTKLAIAGATGCGKTTLALLLPGLFDGYRGTVTIDGIPLGHYDIDSVRARITYITQDVQLFSDTVRNNIDPAGRRTDAEISDITRGVHLDGVVSELRHGIGTVLGRDGTDLSGGERQRIAIARSMAADPDIVIFDEITSALDPDTEERVLAHLMNHFSGKTVIFISHRPAVLQYCGQVCMIENGRIIEQGSPQELCRSGTVFKRIFPGYEACGTAA